MSIPLNRLSFEADLTTQEAEVIVLLATDDMTVQSIADEMGISKRTVQRLKQSAIEKLMDYVADNDVDEETLRYYIGGLL